MNIIIITNPQEGDAYCGYISPAFEHNQFISGLPSERINLSPFTKDFRGGGHLMSLN